MLLVGCIFSTGRETGKQNRQNTEEKYEIARTTPFGKYPEEITYTMGKMTSSNNSNLQEEEL